MTKQEYQHIRNLAWVILIDANITCLPIDIITIADLYHCKNLLQHNKSLYKNTLSVSSYILQTYGYKASYCKYLAIRMLSPIIVLKELNVQSASDIIKFTGLPLSEANKRYLRLQMLLKRNMFETSNLETKLLYQFKPWLTSLNHY